MEDIAKEILRRRPLYLVIMHPEPYDDTTETVGLFWSEKNALVAALGHLLTNLCQDHYDPSQRFRLHHHSEWEDGWSGRVGHGPYVIEEIFPESKQQGWKKTLRFDRAAKKVIIAEHLCTEEVQMLVEKWQSEIAANNIPAPLQSIAISGRVSCEKYRDSRDTWVQQHGFFCLTCEQHSGPRPEKYHPLSCWRLIRGACIAPPRGPCAA